MIIKRDGFKVLFKLWSELMLENRDYLIELDSLVGDADLGITMSEGFLAAYNAIKDFEGNDLGKIAYLAGKSMSVAVPSTMGTLLAQGFMNAGKSLRGMEALNEQGIYTFFYEFYKGVQKLGQAKPGEKTFLDGMTNSLQILKDSSENKIPISELASLIQKAAEKDFQNTTTMVAKHGRAAIRGEDSRLLLDPGACVAKILLMGFAKFVMQSE